MNNLKSEYLIERKDIEVIDKKIVLQYYNILKKHKHLDLRLNNLLYKDLLSIQLESVKRIYSFLENELMEEFILFLFEKPQKKMSKENIINTNKESEINTNKQNEQEEMNDEKREFLTLEVENPVLKKYRTLTYQIMKKYYFGFCLISLLIAILFTIHLFSYLISEEVSININ